MSRQEYVPLPPPQGDEVELLGRYLNHELQRISQFISELSQVTLGQMYLASAPADILISATTTVPVVEYDSANVSDDVDVDITAGQHTILVDGHVEGSFTATVAADSNNTTLTFQFYLNGTAIAGSSSSVFLKTSDEPLPLAFTAVAGLTRGDVLEVRVTNNEAGDRTISYDNLTFTLSSV